MPIKNVNWEKIKAEIVKIKDIDSLKKELNKLASEIKKFDIQAHLSPGALKRLKDLEKKYNEIVKSIQKAQKQLDKEVARVMTTLKKSKLDVEKKFKDFQKLAQKQKSKISKVSTQAKRKATKKKATTTKKKATTKKKTTKKATTKKSS